MCTQTFRWSSMRWLQTIEILLINSSVGSPQHISLQTNTSTLTCIYFINTMTLCTQEVPTATVADGSTVEIPSNFICPITLQVMVTPLMTRTGLTFEKAAIFSWLEQGSGSCPLTRKPLTASDLVTNMRLKKEIRIWRSDNGIPEPTEEEMAAAECKFIGNIKISGGNNKAILDQLSQQPLPLVSTIPSNILDHVTPRSSSSLQRGGLTSEPRRNFLSRILTSATAELDEILALE
jgi:hypothetical protein